MLKRPCGNVVAVMASPGELSEQSEKCRFYWDNGGMALNIERSGCRRRDIVLTQLSSRQATTEFHLDPYRIVEIRER